MSIKQAKLIEKPERQDKPVETQDLRPLCNSSVVESYKDDRIMHLASIGSFILVALKSGIVRVYDAATRMKVSDLPNIQ
jgi:hypothetical protein